MGESDFGHWFGPVRKSPARGSEGGVSAPINIPVYFEGQSLDVSQMNQKGRLFAKREV